MTSAVLEYYKKCRSKKISLQTFGHNCFNIPENCSAQVCVSVFHKPVLLLLNKHILEQNRMNRNVQAPCSNTSVVCLVQRSNHQHSESRGKDNDCSVDEKNKKDNLYDDIPLN